MAGNINDPDDLAEAMEQLNAMVLARAAEERQREDESTRLRRMITARATDSLLDFTTTDGGNGDRFASRRVGQILLDDTKQRPTYWVVDEDCKRWMEDITAKRTRWAREIVNELRAKAHEMLDDAILRGDQQAEDEAKAYLKWAKASDTQSKYHLMSRTACESHGMMVVPDRDFDTRHDVLACHDTLIELHSDEITTRPIVADDMITMTTRARYNPGILRNPPRRVVEYLQMFIPDPAIERLIFKVIGSSILGGNIHRLFVLLLGASTTGKSQLMEAIEAALGSYVGTGKPSVFRNNADDRGRPDILSLLKRRIAIFNEASKEWELHGDRVKDITGGGNVAVRALFSNTVIEARPMFTPFILTNSLPTINGVDSGTKRRLMVISFNHELPAGVAEDPNIKQAFLNDPEVLEWMLARVVQGYVDAAREGLADARAAFALDTARALQQLSPAHAFVTWMLENERLRQLEDGEVEAYGGKSRCVPLAALFTWYSDWVKNYGDLRDKKRMLSERDFNDELRNNLGWRTVQSGTKRWYGWELIGVVNGAATQPFQVGLAVAN